MWNKCVYHKTNHNKCLLLDKYVSKNYSNKKDDIDIKMCSLNLDFEKRIIYDSL